MTVQFTLSGLDLNSFPKTYSAGQMPSEILACVKRLVPLLLEGKHPMLEVLREQFRASNVAEASFSGVGFFAEFKVPATATRTEPADITGGSAYLELNTTDHGGGCVLFVRQGLLATLECFSYVDPWPEDTQILEIKDVEPILT